MDEKMLYVIKPQFRFFYELGMPTGKKFKKPFGIFVICVLIYLFLEFGIGLIKADISKVISLDYLPMIKLFFVVIALIVAIYLLSRIAFQIIQYSSISYTFFENHLEYEDNFLNQHKKKIQYENIREIELKKTVWDRVNGVGIIIIYTNAENEYNNGLVIYSIKDPDEVYKKLDDIIHYRNEQKKDNKTNNVYSEEISNITETKDKTVSSAQVSEETEVENFKDSLKN